MNNAQKATTKTIALFLALGMVSSLSGCEIGDTDTDQDQDNTSTEQAEPNSQDDGGEGGEDGEDGEGN